eukprot:14753964-Alexandrium_andersonii.AAC.1
MQFQVRRPEAAWHVRQGGLRNGEGSQRWRALGALRIARWAFRDVKIPDRCAPVLLSFCFGRWLRAAGAPPC